MKMLFSCCLLLLSLSSPANEVLRPRSHADHSDKLHFEYARKIKGIKIAWANYDALRRDFPEIKDLTNAEINVWLENNLSYIGSQQSRLNGIRNTFIPLDGVDEKEAFRPESWERSAQLEMFSPKQNKKIGMVDIKGFGYGDYSSERVESQTIYFKQVQQDPAKVNQLRIRDHSDGLMSFGEAIAETTRQMAIQKLFELRGLPFETVETYAIFRLPFNILKESGREIPAAFYIRQAHTGRHSHLPISNEIYRDDFGYKQKTDHNTAVDFGATMITDPLLKETYGAINTTDPQSSAPWKWGHDVALAFDRGDTDAVFRHLREMLSPIHKMSSNFPGVKNQESAKTILKETRTLTVEDLKTAIESKTLEEKQAKAIIESLSQLPDEKALPLFQSLHRKSKGPIRILVLEALRNRKDPAALGLAENSFTKGSPPEQKSAILALSSQRGKRALKLIRLALTHPNAQIKNAGLNALESWPEEISLPLVKEVIPNNPFSSAAVRLLSKLKSEESLDILINEYFHKNKMQEQVLESLKYRSDQKSLDFLMQSLNGPAKYLFKSNILTTLSQRADLSDEQRRNFVKDSKINSNIRYLFYKSLTSMSCENVFRPQAP